MLTGDSPTQWFHFTIDNSINEIIAFVDNLFVRNSTQYSCKMMGELISAQIKGDIDAVNQPEERPNFCNLVQVWHPVEPVR